MSLLIINTRPENRIAESTARFLDAGISVLELPAIESVPLSCSGSFLDHLAGATHIMVSSAQIPRFFAPSVLAQLLTLDKKIISIGSKTSEALRSVGFRVWHESSGKNRNHLGSELAVTLEKGSVVCHLCSAITELDPALYAELYGITVFNLPVYTTHFPEKSRALFKKYCDLTSESKSNLYAVKGIVYYSSSAVHAIHALVAGAEAELYSRWSHFALGTSTYKTLSEYHVRNIFMALEPTEESLIQCIKEQLVYE